MFFSAFDAQGRGYLEMQRLADFVKAFQKMRFANSVAGEAEILREAAQASELTVEALREAAQAMENEGLYAANLFGPGTRIAVAGLQTKPELTGRKLNGQSGSVIDFDTEEWQYNVQLDDGVCMAFEPRNIRKASGPTIPPLNLEKKPSENVTSSTNPPKPKRTLSREPSFQKKPPSPSNKVGQVNQLLDKEAKPEMQVVGKPSRRKKRRSSRQSESAGSQAS